MSETAANPDAQSAAASTAPAARWGFVAHVAVDVWSGRGQGRSGGVLFAFRKVAAMVLLMMLFSWASGLLMAGHFLPAAKATTLPFSEGHEGFAVGTVPVGYAGEISPTGAGTIVLGAGGNNVLQLSAPAVVGGAPAVVASVQFDVAGTFSGGGSVGAGKILWAETKVRVPAQTSADGAVPSPVFNLDGALVSFVRTGTAGGADTGRFIVYDGKLGLAAGGGEWKFVGGEIILENASALAATFTTITVRVDYTRRKFDLWLNGNLVAVNFGFSDASLANPLTFSLHGSLDENSFFDDISISTTPPATVPFSTAGDGISDAWKIQNSIPINDSSLRDQTDSSTNLSLIEKFFYGLSATGDGFSELLGFEELSRGFFRECWLAINGLQVSQLRDATARFREPPALVSLTAGAETPQNIANQYGQRLRDYITIPATGDYRFYLTADDRAELYISTTGGKFQKQLAAQVAKTHAGITEWTKNAEQHSDVFSLTAGQKIYVEILHKEDGGSDYARLGWTTPFSQTVALVPDAVVSSFVCDPNDADDDDLPDDWETQYGLSASDNGSVNPENGATGVNNSLGIPNHVAAAAGVSPVAPPATLAAGALYNGVFSRECWTDIAGATVSALKTSPRFLNIADAIGFVQPFGPATVNNNTGERWRGYITVPTTGNYSFGVHSGGTAELYLSSDSGVLNKRQIALVREATAAYQFRFSEQKSVPVALVAGQQYYIEVLFKHGTGGGVFQLTYDPHITNNYVPLPPEIVSSFAPDPAFDRAGFPLAWLAQNNIAPNTLLPEEKSSPDAYFNNWNSAKLNVSPTATGAALNTLFPATPRFGLTHETWLNTSGTLAANLDKFLTEPDRREVVSTGDDFPSQLADNYISRTRGYIVAPVSGVYYFAVNGDDETEVFLSTSDAITGAVRIIIAPCTGWNVWSNAAQKSAAITLAAGEKHYIEIRHREATVSDFLRLAWQLPGTNELTIIPTEALRSFAPAANDPHGFGYPESWFTNAGITTLTLQQRAPWSDPFASGLNNAQNYALGLNPLGTAGAGPFTNIYGHLEFPNRLLHETWTNIAGGSPFALRRNTSDFRNTPNSVGFWHGADRETSVADNYGQRLRGYITIPQTGTYHFYISGDDNAELYVGVNGVKRGKSRAAFTTGSTSVRQWTKHSSQKSAAFSFSEGQKVYIEIQHKEGGGTEYFSLGWTTPLNDTVSVVPPSVVSSFVYDSNDADDDDLPDDWEVAHGLSASDNGATDPLNGKHGIRNTVGLKNYICAALNLDPNNPNVSPLSFSTEAPGVLLREKWENVAGDAVHTFTRSENFVSANAQKTFTGSATEITPAQDTAERWRGFLTAPFTGNYVFGIQAATTAELYISPDVNPLNKRQCATVRGTAQNYSYAEQKTLAISLIAGERYYIELLVKKGATGDAFARLQWTTPIDGDFQNVPDDVLSSWTKGTMLDSSGLPLAWLAQNSLQTDSLSPNATAAGGYLPYFAAARLNVSPTASSSLQNPVAGGLTYDLWLNATGATLADNLHLFLTTPDKREVVTGGDAFPQQLGDSFVARVRGYIVAPATGYYRFFRFFCGQLGKTC